MTRRWLGITAAALLLAACGSDDAEDADAVPTPETPEDTVTVEDDVTVEDTAEDTGEDTGEDAVGRSGAEPEEPTDQPDTESDTQPGTQPDDDASGDDAPDRDEEMIGDADSAWCRSAREVEATLDVLDDGFDVTDPATVEAAFDDILSTLRDVQGLAPDEIAGAVATSVRGFERLDEALAAVDYDFLNADLSVLDDLDAEMTDAGDRIQAYNEDVCGIPADDDGGTDPGAGGDTAGGEGFDPSAGSVREQGIAELVAQGFTEEEAACLFDGIDFSDLESVEDPSRMLTLFDECGIDLARLGELGGGVTP